MGVAMPIDSSLFTGCEMRARHLLRREARAVGPPRYFVKEKRVDLVVHDSDPMTSKIAVICLRVIGHGGGGLCCF